MEGATTAERPRTGYSPRDSRWQVTYTELPSRKGGTGWGKSNLSELPASSGQPGTEEGPWADPAHDPSFPVPQVIW